MTLPGDRLRYAVVSLTVLCSTPSVARAGVAFEVFLGDAKSFGTHLSIQQSGQPDLELSPDYATQAFQFPLYYSLRIAAEQENRRWEIQFTHHKMILENPTSEVERFEITHGFNLLTVNHAWTSLPVTLRVGGGLVITHPESTVRGQGFSPGYQPTGPALLVGAGKSIEVTRRLFVSAEAQLTAARARVSVYQGKASAPNVALHALFGFGLRF